MKVIVRGEALDLLPEKAVFWPREETLLVADLHLGKPDTFVAAGIAVPRDSAATDLATLTRLLERTAARRLVVLGDLLHARAGRSETLLRTVAEWRESYLGLEVLAVRGNHDRRAGDPPPEWGFQMAAEPVLEPPFALRHFPDPTPGAYTLAGHVHPAYTIRGRGRQSLRLPCFWLGPDTAILPAFGGFTGTTGLRRTPGTRVFVIADKEVIEAG